MPFAGGRRGANGASFFQIKTKTTGDCVQFYYFWKKLCVDYKFTHLSTDQPPPEPMADGQANTAQPEARPHVCEMPDCSAVSCTRTHQPSEHV